MSTAPARLRFPPRLHALIAVAVAAAAYLASLAVLGQQPGFSLGEPLFLLAVLGVAFPLLAWASTRAPTRVVAETPPAAASRLPRVLAYLAVFAVLVLGWGFGSVREAVPDEPAQSVLLLIVKLATMAALPLWLFARHDPSRPGPLGARRLLLAFAIMSLAYLALQAVFGRGPQRLAELDPALLTLLWAVPACWLWLSLEAGLAEEVLFRRILQEHLAIASGSQVAAVAWASLLFGLAHAPGLWLRGGYLMEGATETGAAWALAYSVVMIAPAGIAFGVLWARTRSLWLLVPLHGMVDLVPQLAPFIRTWTGA